jgi:hypothetical protein
MELHVSPGPRSAAHTPQLSEPPEVHEVERHCSSRMHGSPFERLPGGNEGWKKLAQ